MTLAEQLHRVFQRSWDCCSVHKEQEACMSSAGRKEKLPSGRRRAEKSVTHGMTEDADPWSQVLSGRDQCQYGSCGTGLVLESQQT